MRGISRLTHDLLAFQEDSTAWRGGGRGSFPDVLGLVKGVEVMRTKIVYFSSCLREI
jgi:hypothetical protein